MSCTWVESVRWRCRGLSQPCSVKTATMASNNTCSAPPSSRRAASVGQNGKVKAGIDPPSNREGFLSIGQSLNELHNGNECKPRGEPPQDAHAAEIHGQR